MAKEQHWLPRLAPLVPLPIPVPVALGRPGEGYAWPWSIYRWLDGEPASAARSVDLPQLAIDLAGFLVALQQVDGAGGPAPGAHNFHRGGSLELYDQEARAGIEALGFRIDQAAAIRCWNTARASRWQHKPAWTHGDVSEGNLLVRNGRLAAVIDFGCLAVGDPACDLAIAWTLLDQSSRATFRSALRPDIDSWDRGRGWALWKALVTCVDPACDPARAARSHHVLRELL